MSRVNRMQPFLLAEIAAACLFLAACGGGGGEPAAADSALASADSAAAPDASGGSDPAESRPGSLWAQSEQSAAADQHLIAADGTPPPPSSNGEELVAGQTDPAAPDAAREDPATLTVAAADRGFAKPKVAALDYTSSTSEQTIELLSQFKMVVLGGRGGADLKSFTAEIQRRSPGVSKIGYYVAFNELRCSPTASNDHYYSAIQAANKADWWLRKADGSRSQWTSSYNTCDMNISQWGKRDSSGRTWMQYKARFDYDEIFKNATAITFAFTDNTFDDPRVDADWKRIRTNQKRTDPTIVEAQREGQVAYWNALRALRPGLKIFGNADNDLSVPEYRQQLDGAMQEAAMGRSWSLETWAGWDKMMERYRGQLRNTKGSKDAILEVRGDPSDYKAIRYGLASAMLEDGWFMFLPSTGAFKAAWYDEFRTPIGNPVEAPPKAPKQNGIWMRKYENGLVLVNPGKTKTASIYVGPRYYRLKGTQDPTVNNGKFQSTVTLGPRQGLLMLKN